MIAHDSPSLFEALPTIRATLALTSRLSRLSKGRGIRSEMLRLSISRLLFLTKADADRASAECTVGQGPRSHAARNAAFIGNDEPCHASEQRDRLVRVAALGFLEIEENWKVVTLPRRRA